MSSETFEVLKLIFSGIAVAVSLASFAYAWHSAKNRAQREEIDTLRREQRNDVAVLQDALEKEAELRRDADNNQRDRITELATNMAHLPDQQQIGKVYESINDVAKQVTGLDATMRAVGAQVTRVEDFLRNKT